MPLQFRKGSFGVGGPTRVRPGGMTATPKVTISAVLPLPSSIDYLVVGGGGSGGQAASPTGSYTGRSGGGGGGAGGLQSASGISITSSTSYTITVGAGGSPNQSLGLTGASGGDSSILHPAWLTSYSGVFNGSSYLSVNSTSALEFGTGPFTIEFWVLCTGSPGYGYYILSKEGAIPWSVFWQGTNIQFNTAGGSASLQSVSNITINTWYHVAIVREGTGTNQTKIYLNGAGPTGTPSSSTGIGTIPGNFTSTDVMYIGGGSPYFNGNISNLRIVKGVAVYTGNFTPSTIPLTATQSAGTNISAITGSQTSFLTFQNPSIIDNSTFSSSITTVAGTVTTQSNTLSYYLSLAIGGASYNQSPYYGGSGSGGQWNGSGYNLSGRSRQSIQPYTGYGNDGGVGLGPLIPGDPFAFPFPTSSRGGGSQGAGGGGGGSTTVGSPATLVSGFYYGGNGGTGTVSTITGSSVYYAAGGGGGGGASATGGSGGSGIGGDGGRVGVNSGAGGNGSPNTGSGGGGVASTTTNTVLYTAGSGGSGVAIIAYPSSYAPITTISGGLTYTVDTTTRSGYRVYTFTSGTGTISW